VRPEHKPPDLFTVLENFPNPFNAVTCINFYMYKIGWAEIEVFDILGRQVFERRFDKLLPGVHSLFWDTQHSNRGIAASGIYICTLQSEEGSRSRKMVLIK